MKKVTVRAPVRADLAGGTLDLWPLYLFHPGSRTINVAISYHAESEVAGEPVQGDDLIALVRDLETRLIRVPAGIQDYYPPVYGGLMAIHLNPGAVVRHQIALPVDRLGEHMLLHYTGVAHFSGTN